jgi:23S rRNA G2069 N7-methylase RlmK/C1962 C5-methylase RlmI
MAIRRQQAPLQHDHTDDHQHRLDQQDTRTWHGALAVLNLVQSAAAVQAAAAGASVVHGFGQRDPK